MSAPNSEMTLHSLVLSSDSFSCNCDSINPHLSIDSQEQFSHFSSIVAIVYKLQHFQCILTSSMYSNVTTSTRINSSSVHMYIFVCSTLRVILQGFVDPKCNTIHVYLSIYSCSANWKRQYQYLI